MDDMTKKQEIQLFEDKKGRTVWDDEKEKWFFRDNMTHVEIALNTLAEASAAELSKQRNPKGYKAQKCVAKDGGVWQRLLVNNWRVS